MRVAGMLSGGRRRPAHFTVARVTLRLNDGHDRAALPPSRRVHVDHSARDSVAGLGDVTHLADLLKKR